MNSDPQKTMQNAALVQNFASPNPIPIDLVKQGPQAHAEAFRRYSTIAVGRSQGVDDRLAFSTLNDVAQPADLTPGLLLRFAARGSGVKVLVFQNRFFIQHRRPFDRVF